jgi:hypothetical protein
MTSPVIYCLSGPKAWLLVRGAHSSIILIKTNSYISLTLFSMIFLNLALLELKESIYL